MPSLMSRLSLKPSRPKVFAKAMDNVKKTLSKTPSLRKNKSKKKDELIVVEESAKYADENIEDAENYAPNGNVHRDSVDVTNSVMIHNLSALQENSILEREENSVLENSVVVHENARDDSMATFIADDEDSLLEEKAERPPSSSPIQFVVDQSMADEVEPQSRESLNALSLDEPAAESVHEASVVKVRTISISEPVVAPVETEAKSSIVHEEEVVAPIVVEEKSESSVPSNVSKPDIFETLKRNNLAARSTGSVGNLRARFENGGSKAPTPTLRSVLAARNSAKFARKEETFAAQTPVIAPKHEEITLVEIPVKEVEEQKPVEAPVEVVEPAVVEVSVAPVQVQAEEQPKEEIVEESKPVVAAVVSAIKVSTNTELLAKGDEKALLSAMMEIAAKPYKEQAVWFLNAYWNETFKDNIQQCERVWQFCNKFAELDSQGAKGCELDELRAHRVLEVLAEALTFTEMRTKFHRRAKHVSLIELLIFVFSADWTQVVMAPQGSDAAMEQMQQAEALMAKSSAALEESKTTASQAAEDEKRAEETARLALESKNKAVAGETQATEAEARAIASETESTRREEEAAQAFEAASRAAEESAKAEAETVKRAEECAQAESEARQVQEQAAAAERKAVADEHNAREAESEAFRREQAARDSEQSAMEAEKCLIEGQARVEAALNKVKEEEAAFHKLLEDLKEKSENTSIGIVARRTAAHEREVLLAKNPDPLTRARIAEEAVVRKHEKLIRQAAGARAAASVARAQAEESRDHAVKSRVASEDTRAESAVRRSASETKAAAAAESRQASEVARESARKAREESESRRKASDDALEFARQAKESATQARLIASQEREAATAFKIAAEKDEQEALTAKDLASKSRENAEQAVVEAVNAFERARQFVERVRKQASSGQGGWWWASREIEESKRYVPQRMLKKLAEQQLF